MTTIACNKEEVYGDLQFTNHSTGNKWKGETKVYRYKPHPLTCHVDFIVGYAGTAQEIVTVHSFFSEPDMFDKPPRPPRGLTGLVLTADKDIYMFNDYSKWLIVKEPFSAIGSGSEYAKGAMSQGASPKEAVKVAMKHDSYTGLGLKGYRID